MGLTTKVFRTLILLVLVLLMGSRIALAQGGSPSYPSGAMLRIKEADGSPNALPVTQIVFPNGSLTRNGASVTVSGFVGSYTGAVTFTSTANPCFAVGPNGTTNPTISADCSVASATTGIKITPTAGSGVIIAATGGTNENLTIAAKGTGAIIAGSKFTPVALAQTNVPQTGTGGGTTTLDLSAGNLHTITTPATGNFTITASNVIVGLIYVSVIQGAGGSHLVTWNSLFKFSGGIPPVLTITAAARDNFVFWCDGVNCHLQSSVLNTQ